VSPLQRTALTIEERATKYLATCDPAVSGAGGHNITFRVCVELALPVDAWCWRRWMASGRREH
jgi:hypothetical protein